MSNCLSVDTKMKQCLLEVGHKEPHLFTLLAPERAQEADRRKARDANLTRRLIAEHFISAVLSSGVALTDPSALVNDTLMVADDLISKTGGH